MRTVVGFLLAGLMAGGCAHALGYAGANPGAIECSGKGSITGTGSMSAGAGVGGAGMNTFTVQADCGDGFVFKQYKPESAK
jgi:hypothetical protein